MSDGTKFKKGGIPWNKGLKRRLNSGRTHFKKGQTSWNKGTKGIMRAWNKGTGKIINRECEICLRRFKIPAYYASKGRFCSTRCTGISKRKEQNPNWIGGSWLYVRKIILIEQDFTCQDCGLQDKEVVEVNHKLPRADYPELANDKNNLEVLCANCHRRKTNAYLRSKRRGE